MPSSRRIIEHIGFGLRHEREEWTEDDVQCRSCGEVWIARRPIGLDFTRLECPACNTFDSELYDKPNEFIQAPSYH